MTQFSTKAGEETVPTHTDHPVTHEIYDVFTVNLTRSVSERALIAFESGAEPSQYERSHFKVNSLQCSCSAATCCDRDVWSEYSRTSAHRWICIYITDFRKQKLSFHRWPDILRMRAVGGLWWLVHTQKFSLTSVRFTVKTEMKVSLHIACLQPNLRTNSHSTPICNFASSLFSIFFWKTNPRIWTSTQVSKSWQSWGELATAPKGRMANSDVNVLNEVRISLISAEESASSYSSFWI